MALPKLIQKLFQNGGAGGRLNRGIMPAEMVGVDAQSFTEAQKQQGRANLGAGSQSDVDALATGLAAVETGLATVESDLASKLETSTTHIVETWSSGTQFYRKWSDGWIEQGGYAESSTQDILVNLLVPFSDNNYKALVVSKTAGSCANYNPAVSSKSTTSFVYNSMIAQACGIDWYAFGY